MKFSNRTILQTIDMKNIVIAFAIITLLTVQTQACFGIIRPPFVNIHPPRIPVPSPPKCFEPPRVQPPPPPRDQPLSNIFTLSLSYICRPTFPFQSCLGEVVWNNAIVASIIPSNYHFQSLSLEVTAKDGKNILQFVGAGTSDHFGLLINDVKLVRKGTSNNIVVNGDFEQPFIDRHSPTGWAFFNNIPGWEGKGIEIGFAPKAYGFGSGQLCELDSSTNYQITQQFTFDHLFRQIENQKDFEDTRAPLKYNLEFDWAIRESNTHPDTSKANVLWNDVVVASLQTCNRGINHVNIPVDLRAGDNDVQFDGTSFSDGFGITIDNVKLTSRFNSNNLIVNGDFNEPCVGSGWSYFKGGIPGWSAVNAEVGDGKNNYNCNWRSGQVIELDSDSNQRYTQVIRISDQVYRQLFNQANPISCH